MSVLNKIDFVFDHVFQIVFSVLSAPLAGIFNSTLSFFVFLQCSIEWFHFACVGLTTKPRGKW